MKANPVTIKRALISVSNKQGLVEFARGLRELGIEIISTGGTSNLLREADILVREVEEITQFPEMMDGRVKTLHPKIHGGILGKRDAHAEIAKQQEIPWIDLVVVNLYPFADTIRKPNVTLNEAIENIDIGGPTMIRSAAKNMQWVTVVVDANDYGKILSELREHHAISFKTRQSLATKAFQHTSAYDALIHHYLQKTDTDQSSEFPSQIYLVAEKQADLRYGENPHQKACAYRFQEYFPSVMTAKQYQGKPLSYNNIVDADAAVGCVREFSETACVIVKHANPSGVAIGGNIQQAFSLAYQADELSAFGGVIALNKICDEATAKQINEIFFEVLIAPAYTQGALAMLSAKTNLRVLELPELMHKASLHEYKFVEGGVLLQDKDYNHISPSDLTVVTQLQPNKVEIDAAVFAWRVVKHAKSNAILIAKENRTVGIGAGLVSRIDAVDMAVRKAAKNLPGSVLASDAFFPFRDSIDRIANLGIRTIIQPGGSMRDEEVIAACNQHGIAMILTGKRCFKH